MVWDNGDRSILVNPSLGGVTFGWKVLHTAADEMFAAIEGTALHTRVIVQRMMEKGTPVHRILNSGGIPQRNKTLNQVYANALRKSVLVPEGDVTSLGSAIFAFLACGAFSSVEEAQAALCPPFKTYVPDEGEAETYDRLYQLFSKMYFSLGRPDAGAAFIGDVLPTLDQISSNRKLQGTL